MRTSALVLRILTYKNYFVQDIVLLNKIDLVIGGVAAVAELEMQIHNINALVKIVQSERCQVDLDVLLKQRAYEVQVREKLSCFSSHSPFSLCFQYIMPACEQQAHTCLPYGIPVPTRTAICGC